METVPLRLPAGQDLKAALDKAVRTHGWPAAVVLSGIGSLHGVEIRFAGRESTVHIDGPLEILSLGGTLSPDGSHLHLLVSDENGATTGGHLKPGAIVRTTAEILIGVLPEWEFGRKMDPATGHLELTVRKRPD